MLQGIIGLLVAFLLIIVIAKAIKISFPVVKKLLVNGVLGAIGLFIFNIFGSAIGINISFNVINSLIAGFFGVPGVILLLIFG